MRAALLATVTALLAHPAHAQDDASAQDDCATLLSYIEQDFSAYTTDCTTSTGQLRARAIVDVPAADVQDWHIRLQQDYGMGALRWVCCGYETSTGGMIPIDPASPLAQVRQPGALPGISISLTAHGFTEAGDIAALGDLDAVIIIEWVEV